MKLVCYLLHKCKESFCVWVNALINDFSTAISSSPSLKGAVSQNSAKLGNYKMPVKLGET